MKPRFLGIGFLSLAIYLLGMYAIASFLCFQADSPDEFTIRLAFVPKDFSVLGGMQLFIGLYVVVANLFLWNRDQAPISKFTSVGFWMLASSTFLFGIKLILLTFAFVLTSSTHLVSTLSQMDWMYGVFEWMLDFLFYLAMMMFLGAAWKWWRKRKGEGY